MAGILAAQPSVQVIMGAQDKGMEAALVQEEAVQVKAVHITNLILLNTQKGAEN